VEWLVATDALGGETDTESLTARFDWAFSIGRTRLVPGIETGIDLNDGSEFGGGFDLGGLFRLSGYAPLELIGRESLLGRVVAYRRLNKSIAGVIRAGWYAGVSIEAGNVYDSDESIDSSNLIHGGSLFVGADSPLGPVILGVGVAEGGRDRFYLSFGRSFL